MYSKVLTSSLYGLEAEATWVEVEVDTGLPNFNIVGLANQSIKEAKERIHAALENSGFEFRPHRITVNLTPANKRKEGNHYDLPIAVGLLLSTGQIRKTDRSEGCAFLGELTLSGKLMPAEGVLSMIIGMQKQGVRRVAIPRANLKEAMLVKDMELIPVDDLKQLADHLDGISDTSVIIADGKAEGSVQRDIPDFADIRGQESVKRAAQLAAAGRHGLLLVGPPGVGKSMIGKRIPGIMPPLSSREELDVTQIYSACGMLTDALPMITERPFRAPHHSISGAALTGGGSRPSPGEISLAHCGVLFLDELPEFSAHTLDMLRQPLEDGQISIMRVNGKVTYPSRFMLVAAMNPCRCGMYGDAASVCTCTESDRRKYVGRISGPLLDRIDIHAAVEKLPFEDISNENTQRGTSSEELKKRVMTAYEIQKERYKNDGIASNSELTPQLMAKYCRLDNAGRKLVETAFVKWKLSARAYHRLLKVARTAADTDASENIKEEHILEALSYRQPERFFK